MAFRRYKIGMNPVYDALYDRFRLESPILNPSRATSVVSWINIYDRKGIENALRQWSEYRESAEQQFEDIKAKFETFKQRQINEGRPAPKKMPPELQEDQLKVQAKYDVVRDEIAELEKKLKAYTDEDQKELDKQVLKGGPKGSSRIQGGVIVEVDGQAVVPDSEGVLRIRDSRSRYDGMSTADYFELIVKPWKRETKRLRKEQQQKMKNGELRERDAKRVKAPLPPKPEESKQKEAVNG